MRPDAMDVLAALPPGTLEALAGAWEAFRPGRRRYGTVSTSHSELWELLASQVGLERLVGKNICLVVNIRFRPFLGHPLRK